MEVQYSFYMPDKKEILFCSISAPVNIRSLIVISQNFFVYNVQDIALYIFLTDND